MADYKIDTCPICKSKANYLKDNGEFSNIKCTRCGNYQIDQKALAHFLNEEYSDNVRYNISSWLYTHQGISIIYKDIEFLVNVKVPTISERADKLLIYFSEKFPLLGEEFELDDNRLMAIIDLRRNDFNTYTQVYGNEHKEIFSHQSFALSWCQSVSEFCFLLFDYLAYNNYIEVTDRSTLRILQNGWQRIEELKQKNPKSNICFVAMWFDTKVNNFYKIIEESVTEVGYKPLRIDRLEHNNKIDDEIIAGIKKSKFAICDFNANRENVYFESGYALGFGLQVIWTCKKDEIDKIKFDNRQYNFILWEEDKLDDFKKALQNRIEATIGRPVQL